MKLRLTKEKVIHAILSLIFAFFLWLIATTNTNPISTPRYSGIQVEYTNLPGDLIVENEISTVDIKLYGTTSLLRQINRDNIRAVIDLSQCTAAGEYTIEVVILGLPDNVTVTDISQKYVQVKLANLVSAEINYTIETTGTPASGFIVLFVDKPTQYITVSGSENLSEKISYIKGIVDVNGISTDFTSDVKLYAYDSKDNRLDDIILTPATVKATVVIGTTKTVPVNILTSGQCAVNYSLSNISLNHSSVVLSGKSGILAGISQIDSIPIDISGASSSFDANVSLNLPNGVSLTQNYEIVAHIEIEGDATKTFTYDTLQVRNLPQNNKIALQDSVYFNITVTGTPSVINSLNKEAITPYVDLNELSEGTHTVSINYDLPSGITVSQSSMQTVNIVLSAE